MFTFFNSILSLLAYVFAPCCANVFRPVDHSSLRRAGIGVYGRYFELSLLAHYDKELSRTSLLIVLTEPFQRRCLSLCTYDYAERMKWGLLYDSQQEELLSELSKYYHERLNRHTQAADMILLTLTSNRQELITGELLHAWDLTGAEWRGNLRETMFKSIKYLDSWAAMERPIRAGLI